VRIVSVIGLVSAKGAAATILSRNPAGRKLLSRQMKSAFIRKRTHEASKTKQTRKIMRASVMVFELS